VQAQIRVEPSHHDQHRDLIEATGDAVASRPPMAAASSDARPLPGRSCEHGQGEEVDGVVRGDLQCRQISASGLMDSLQKGQTPLWSGSAGSTGEPQCLHFSACALIGSRQKGHARVRSPDMACTSGQRVHTSRGAQGAR